MRIKSLMLSLATIGMATVPVAASAANPAASLSIGSNVRAASPTVKDSDLAGAGLVAVVILAGIIAIGVIAIINDSEDPASP